MKDKRLGNGPDVKEIFGAWIAGMTHMPWRTFFIWNAAGGFTWAAFVTQLASAASFNVTSAPYVSDYSRYLPADTPRFRIIRHVFAGAALSAIWLIALGAWLATHLGSEDGLLALAQAGNLVLPHWGALLAYIEYLEQGRGGRE